MPTIARGNTAEIFCPLDSSITFTPGSGGAVRVSVSAQSGDPSIAPQFIQSATAVSFRAGATVFAEAINTDATYTEPAGRDGSLQALVSQYGIADPYIDHVASGMVLPTTGGLVNNITAGVAYLQGNWVAFVGATITLTASRDNYIDALPDGTYSVQPVTNGGAAPAIPVNGLRLGYVVTGASTVSSATTTGRDSLGNWMGNRVRVPACYLGQANTQALTGGSVDNFISFASAALEQLDNAQMHSVSTNPTRITAPRAGLYRVTGWATWLISSTPGAVTFTVRKQGGSAVLGMPIDTFTANGVRYSALVTGDIFLNLGEFIELRIQVGTGISLTNAGFSAVWVG